MLLPKSEIPITEIKTEKNVRLFIKREDLIHSNISGNKFWKLFYNILDYQEKNPAFPLLITFGGAFSNHIFAVAALGKDLGFKTLGIIRGEELQQKWQQNPTLVAASKNGMDFRFVSREIFRDKKNLAEKLRKEFPYALIIPEGGTNFLAVEGIQHMLDRRTTDFDYLCCPVGTGGTVAGLSKFANENQKVIGFKVVNDDSLHGTVKNYSGKENFELINAHFGGYGKVNDELIKFINNFKLNTDIPLEPIYTGKMMKKLLLMIHEDFFPEGSKILAFHTGGLQGIEGANKMLAEKNKELIKT